MSLAIHDSFDNQEVAINLVLFKMLQFFYLCNPKSLRIFNYNIYHLIVNLYTVITQCIVAFGSFGFFNTIVLNNNDDRITLPLFIVIQEGNFLALMKISFIIYNSDKIWDLLNLTRLKFLTSSQCSKYTRLLHENHINSITITNVFSSFAAIVALLWVVSPIVVNVYMIKSGIQFESYENIFNFQYPVSLRTYNQYFFIFYTFEIILSVFLLYCLTLFNSLFITFAFVLITQYEILALAYENIGQGRERGNF